MVSVDGEEGSINWELKLWFSISIAKLILETVQDTAQGPDFQNLKIFLNSS